MKYDRERLIGLIDQGEKLTFIPFWGHTPDPRKVNKACLSQWFDCRFELFGEAYHTAEQYMMAQKAALFKDWATYERIMEADGPGDYKALGREVKRFDADLWDREKYRIVLMGNLAKFSQNPELLEYLFSTGDSILVEASPFDAVWGVKLGIDDPRISDPSQWQGENLLGFALMETRFLLREWKAFLWDEVNWNHYTDQSHKDGDEPDSTEYDSTGFIVKDGKWGLLRNDGSTIGRKELIVFFPQWDRCEEMKTGYTSDNAVKHRLYFSDPSTGFYRARLENAHYFVRVCKDGKYGVVDTAGRIIAPCKWDEIDDYGNARMGGSWGFVDLITREETPPQWKENKQLRPYEIVWSAYVITNFGDMFGFGSRDRHLEWTCEMAIFREHG